jgi:hypothetical protein
MGKMQQKYKKKITLLHEPEETRRRGRGGEKNKSITEPRSVTYYSKH